MVMYIALCLCNCLHSPRGRAMRNFLTMWRPLQLKDLLWQDLWFDSNLSWLTWDLNSPQNTPKQHRPNGTQSQGWGGVTFWLRLRGDTYWIRISSVGSDTMLTEKTGSIKRLGTAFMGVVDNTLLHVRTEGRYSKIKGEIYFNHSLGKLLWE